MFEYFSTNTNTTIVPGHRHVFDESESTNLVNL